MLLGKEVVFARDTPNFIANRIGVFIMLESVRLMQEEDLTIEEVDSLTGSVIGWPRTGTFRLADMVGIDVLAHVAANFEGSGAMPPFVKTMLERRWLGDKTKQGFYKKEKDAAGKEVRLVLDWKTLEYVPAVRPKIASLEMAKNAEQLPDRLAQLLSGDVRKDKAARFHWRLLSALWNYAADCLPEIADDVSSVDRAMRAGFNWEMGPFQLWDAAGVPRTVQRMRDAGEPVSAIVAGMLAKGADSWYRHHGRECFDVNSGKYREIAGAEGIARIAKYRAANGVVRHNPGASLIDLGDGVACLELHSKKNAVGEDIVRLVTETFAPGSNAVRDFEAFVICWRRRALLRRRQPDATPAQRPGRGMGRRRFRRPRLPAHDRVHQVLPAPRSGRALLGFCLGGGAEIAIHGALRQAHAELYMGLVETGVGVVPAGGGCKEMLLRALDVVQAVHGVARNESPELARSIAPNLRNDRDGQGVHLGRGGAPDRHAPPLPTASP